MMKNLPRLFLRFSLVGVLLLFSACGGNQDPEESPLSEETLAGVPLDEGGFVGIDDPVELGGRDSFAEMTAIDSSAYAPVYFAFDSSVVAPGELFKVREVARTLNNEPAYAVVLRGHTDERGSREYNLALGERRALAVREALIAQGVPPDRIQTLSLGEEEPAVEGFGESAWSLNRRVEFQLMR